MYPFVRRMAIIRFTGSLTSSYRCALPILTHPASRRAGSWSWDQRS